jgi:hypothetical protein
MQDMAMGNVQNCDNYIMINYGGNAVFFSTNYFKYVFEFRHVYNIRVYQVFRIM